MSLLRRERASEDMRAISAVAVVVAALVAGVIAVAGIGIGCFHCGAEAVPLILGAGLIVTVVVGGVGFTLRRRLLSSSRARRLAVSLLVGAFVGAGVSVASWMALFNQPGLDEARRTYPSRELAIQHAIAAAGRHRWPGTTAEVRDIDANEVEVRRLWLGLPEGDVGVQREGTRWVVESGPTTGAGWLLQVVLACIVPGAACAALTARRVHRR